jgi:hypothetical protein
MSIRDPVSGLVGVGVVFHWTLVLATAVLGATQIVLVFGLFGGTGIWGSTGLVMKTTRVFFFIGIFATIWSVLVRRRDALPPSGS